MPQGALHNFDPSRVPPSLLACRPCLPVPASEVESLERLCSKDPTDRAHVLLEEDGKPGDA